MSWSSVTTQWPRAGRRRLEDAALGARFMPSRSRYNVSISDEPKFIWFRVAKVGTRTLIRALQDQGVVFDPDFSGRYYPGASPDHFAFAFVRNPFERVVSAWKNKVVNAQSSQAFGLQDHDRQRFSDFPTFAREFLKDYDVVNGDRHLRLQTRLVDLDRVDFLGRHESFGEDVDTVFDNLGLQRPCLERLNTSSYAGAISEHFDDESIRIVSEKYRLDLQVFGYSFPGS